MQHCVFNTQQNILLQIECLNIKCARTTKKEKKNCNCIMNKKNNWQHGVTNVAIQITHMDVTPVFCKDKRSVMKPKPPCLPPILLILQMTSLSHNRL